METLQGSTREVLNRMRISTFADRVSAGEKDITIELTAEQAKSLATRLLLVTEPEGYQNVVLAFNPEEKRIRYIGHFPNERS